MIIGVDGAPLIVSTRELPLFGFVFVRVRPRRQDGRDGDFGRQRQAHSLVAFLGRGVVMLLSHLTTVSREVGMGTCGRVAGQVGNDAGADLPVALSMSDGTGVLFLGAPAKRLEVPGRLRPCGCRFFGLPPM